MKSNEAKIIDAAVKNSVGTTVKEIKAIEVDNLNAAISALETELEAVTSRASRIKASIDNEVSALVKERESTFAK